MWVVLFLLFLNALALQGRDTTCSVPGVEEGDQTQLTCHFPSDISDSQYNIKVMFYPETNSNNNKTVAYSALSNGKHEFFIHPDYLFDDNVSDQVNILIPKASKAYEGKYVCQSDPSFTAKSCTFTLRAAGAHAESIKSTTAAIMLNEKEFRQSENLNTFDMPTMVLVAILTVLFIGVIIAAVVIYCKISKSSISKTSRTNNSSDSETRTLLDEQTSSTDTTDAQNP